MNLLDEKISEVKSYISEISKLNEAISLIYWDIRTSMPPKAGETRSSVISYLSGEVFKKSTSTKVGEFIKELKVYKDQMNKVQLRMLEELEKEYSESKKIPQDRYVAHIECCNKAEIAWETAKENNDYDMFKPHLQKLIEFQKEFAEYLGYNKTKYDTLLDRYESGLNVEKLDIIFTELKEGIIEILNNLKKSNKKINRDFLNGHFDTKDQKELSIEVLKAIGFDLNAGVLDVSVHPFTINVSKTDVRLTTNYHEDEFTPALYSTIHEGGHGIYEQNISDEYKDTALDSAVSMAIHESQSRFYENIIGRSKEFCEYILPLAKKYFEGLKDVSLDEFYEAINYVSPSLIRTEADELTYGLHIIIRYEIEKLLINEEINIDDIPRLWNEKYKEYLGIEPENYRDGVLQDVHWAGGMFGYFPSYALGNLYGAQMYYKLLEEKPEVMTEISKGNFAEVKAWLNENVHKNGKLYKPNELIKNISGEELSAKYFIKYLKDKYYKIYDIE